MKNRVSALHRVGVKPVVQQQRPKATEDARAMIISKQRSKISDARVILARKRKLTQLKQQKQQPLQLQTKKKQQAQQTRVIGKSGNIVRTAEGLKTIKKKKVTIKEQPKTNATALRTAAALKNIAAFNKNVAALRNVASLRNAVALKKLASKSAFKSAPVAPRKRRVEYVELSDDEDYVEDDDQEMEDLSTLRFTRKPLTRTVHNNYVQPPMPPLPNFSRTITSDPFDCYEPYQRPASYITSASAPSIDVEKYFEAIEPQSRKGPLRLVRSTPLPFHLHSESSSAKQRSFSS